MRMPYFIVAGYVLAANAARVRPKMSSARASRVGAGEGAIMTDAIQRGSPSPLRAARRLPLGPLPGASEAVTMIGELPASPSANVGMMPSPRKRDPFRTRDFELFAWQRDAVDAWIGNEPPYRGTLEIFTGGGKSIVALACAEAAAIAAAKASGDFRALIVVPTKGLADQWIETVTRHTNLTRTEVGMLSVADAATAFDRHVVVVSIINTAAKLANIRSLTLPEQGLLIVDECHRAGAPSFRTVLDLGTRFRLGLSATPERDELGEDGEPLEYDEQIVAKKLGRVVYSFGLADARAAGRLPDYEIQHHGVTLEPAERKKYDDESGEIDDLSRRMRAVGVEPGKARAALRGLGAAEELARAYLAKTAMRKDLLYRAVERERVALAIVERSMADPNARILIFNERIDAVASLEMRLRAIYGSKVEIEHSQLSTKARRGALARFRTGDAQILISVKSLIEGIDVPDATVGISVASTASVRQRVQALGRVLRKGQDDKRATMHVIYVSESVDESIYEKEDWSDLTGASRNLYFRWGVGEEARLVGEPPKRPRPTETQMADVLHRSDVSYPAAWPGVVSGQEYSVDTKGNVKNAFGTSIRNGQDVATMVRAARGTAGGRFRVTPRFRFVLVLCHGKDGVEWKVAGKLAEPFEARDAIETLPRGERRDEPGEPYFGPATRERGEYKLRARAGGIIERKRRGGAAISLLGDGASADEAANARRVLAAWKRLSQQGFTFYVNDEWDAWYECNGAPAFIAHVEGGFCFGNSAGNET